ncbi:hypothetical protein OH76DRAFT_1412764 [Lentinus brumalis]|uniref:Uncharacterized protein n=1 Tax=Lentinus brumalis TaxID=2498619 RepID=A0A371CKC8_9APHY|nr:hypothetical protein OH76DRAFT_1412764 [Polyporus brumalis]
MGRYRDRFYFCLTVSCLYGSGGSSRDQGRAQQDQFWDTHHDIAARWEELQRQLSGSADRSPVLFKGQRRWRSMSRPVGEPIMELDTKGSVDTCDRTGGSFFKEISGDKTAADNCAGQYVSCMHKYRLPQQALRTCEVPSTWAAK